MKRKTKKTAAGGGALRLLVRILYCVVPSAIMATYWMWAWSIAVVFGIGMFWLGWQVTKPMPERGESMQILVKTTRHGRKHDSK